MTEQTIRDVVNKEHEAVKRKRHIKTELSQIGAIRSASDFSSVGGHSGISNPTADEAIRREALENELAAADGIIDECRRILRNAFRRIKDPLLRTISRCRLVKQMRWSTIADLVNMDVQAVKMRYYRYWRNGLAKA